MRAVERHTGHGKQAQPKSPNTEIGPVPQQLLALRTTVRSVVCITGGWKGEWRCSGNPQCAIRDSDGRLVKCHVL